MKNDSAATRILFELLSYVYAFCIKNRPNGCILILKVGCSYNQYDYVLTTQISGVNVLNWNLNSITVNIGKKGGGMSVSHTSNKDHSVSCDRIRQGNGVFIRTFDMHSYDIISYRGVYESSFSGCLFGMIIRIITCKEVNHNTNLWISCNQLLKFFLENI